MMNFEMLKRLIIVIVSVSGFTIAAFYLSTLIFPFLIAWLIALIMNPFVNFLQYSARLPRGLAVLLVLCGILCIITGTITLLIAELFAITEYLSKHAPQQLQEILSTIEHVFITTLFPKIQQLIDQLIGLENREHNTITTQLNDILTNLLGRAGLFMQTALSKITGFLSWLPKAFTSIIFMIIATFLISKDWYRIKQLFGRFLPDRFKQRGLKIFYDLRAALFGYIRAQFIIIFISTMIVFSGLLILKVQYPFTSALMIGIVDLIPFLGTGIVFIPWIIYEWLIHNHPMAIGLFVLYVVVIVTRQFIEPKIVSTNIGMNPLATLLSIFIGWKLLGFLGIILAPALFVLIQAIYKAGIFSDLWKYIQGG